MQGGGAQMRWWTTWWIKFDLSVVWKFVDTFSILVVLTEVVLQLFSYVCGNAARNSFIWLCFYFLCNLVVSMSVDCMCDLVHDGHHCQLPTVPGMFWWFWWPTATYCQCPGDLLYHSQVTGKGKKANTNTTKEVIGKEFTHIFVSDLLAQPRSRMPTKASHRKLFPQDAAGSAFNGLVSGFKYQKTPAQPIALARQILLAESLSCPPSRTLDIGHWTLVCVFTLGLIIVQHVFRSHKNICNKVYNI